MDFMYNNTVINVEKTTERMKNNPVLLQIVLGGKGKGTAYKGICARDTDKK